MVLQSLIALFRFLISRCKTNLLIAFFIISIFPLLIPMS